MTSCIYCFNCNIHALLSDGLLIDPAMAVGRNVPKEDREEVVAYVGAQFKGLHQGNVIRYGLKPGDLAGIERVSLLA